MKKTFAIGAASIAIMASLSSAAHAQAQDGGNNLLSIATDGLLVTSDGSVSSDSTLAPMSLDANAVEPNYRNIDPFYGNIDPFYGDIVAFYGDINPFYGDINPFYGNIDPFYGDINPFYGNISPFYGDISPFWGDIQAFYGDIAPFDSAYLTSIGNFWQDTTSFWLKLDAQWDAAQSTDLVALASIQAQLKELVARSEAQWGKKVQEKTDQGFYAGFAEEVLTRHGIDMNDPASLAGLSAAQRAAFFMDWHDSLMSYSGFDHVDHWMGQVNWMPAITQQQGGGSDSIIGIIDSSLISDPDLADNVVWTGGSEVSLGGHGAGVASLLYAAHDGEGVMGIAPNVKVTTYNPFDAEGNAEWSDITTAIHALKTSNASPLIGTTRASIINLSLGESGWTLAPDSAEVFSNRLVSAHRNTTVYVLAAGNDGLAQSADVEWNFETDPAMIVVGSVNPNGDISFFSNQPGTACLLDNGVCHEENRLMNRFIVAPGELLLVSDGEGNLVRRSGTSFAAPLVSGTIALLHDRWPWLNKHPDETVDIILRSARDLGEPGVDPVYGWGMLDVLASQSPLNFNAMTFTLYQKRGPNYKASNRSAADLATSGLQDWWETNEVFFHMIEHIGNTHRDFSVPMSSVLYGKRTNVGGDWQYLQQFVSARFAEWILSGGSDSNGDGRAGFGDLQSVDSTVNGGWNLRYDAVLPRLGAQGELRPTHAAATLTDPTGKVSMTLGYGSGAMGINGDRFAMMSDHDRYTGGVNPVLGFASGDSFAAASYGLSQNTRVQLGYSESTFGEKDMVGLSDEEFGRMSMLDDHEAYAVTMDVEHQLNRDVTVGMQYTYLNEDEALFGTQSTLDDLLGSGTSTQALTASAGVEMGHGLMLDLSATAARTTTHDGQALNANAPVWSTAGQLALTKHGVIGKRDALRLSIAQPLTVENGDLELVSLGVVDRETGELGQVVQEFSIETKRRVVGEATYVTPVGDDGELALFGRYQSQGNPGETENYVIGGSLNLRF